jgi:hypothetical protein
MIRLCTLTVAAVAMTAGCSTSPTSLSQASHGQRFAFTEQRPGTVMVTIIRDSGLMSAACATDIMVDGRPAGSVGSGQAIQLHIPAGEVIIGAQQGGICAGGLVEREANLQVGRSMTFRVGFDHNGGMGLYRTTPRT